MPDVAVGLEISRLTRSLAPGLHAMLREVAAEAEQNWFQPHPFDLDHLATLGTTQGQDLYYVLHVGEDVVGYGLLRGWDEGFAIPSLGIAIRRSRRGRGLGTLLMDFLHAAASERGADRIRLRVDCNNRSAITLYRRLGYVFEPAAEPHASTPLLTAFKELRP